VCAGCSTRVGQRHLIRRVVTSAHAARAGMTSRHPVVTAGHRQRHDVSTGLDSTELGCPWYARFVPLSIHSWDGRGMPQPSFSCTVSGGHRYSDVGPRVLCAAFHRQRVHLRPENCPVLGHSDAARAVDRRLARCAVHWRMPAWPFAAVIWGSAGYKERTGLKRWSTRVIGRLRHVREIPDERTARQNS
jgi:hypothetical protein